MKDAVHSRSARACAIAAILLASVSRIAAAAEGWSAEAGGTALAGEWRAEKSNECRGTVAVKSGLQRALSAPRSMAQPSL